MEEYNEILRYNILEGLKKWQKSGVLNQLKNGTHFATAIKKLTVLAPKFDQELYNRFAADSK